MVLKKAVVLIVVLGTMIVLTIFGLVAVNLMTQESRIAEHKIRRIQAFYAAQAGIVHATERLRREGAAYLSPAPGASQTDNSIFVGAGLPVDSGYPAAGYHVVVTLSKGTGPSGTDTLDAQVDYTR
jgi:Tfp pilus assembly protein PilX